jgi:RNase H-like domain found in reverse transcriptase
VAAIRCFPRPNTIKELQAFLGLVNFYQRFVRSAAKLLLPLTAALAGGPAGSTKLQWSAAMAAVFAAMKEAVKAACELQHLARGTELAMATDASASHIGAVLQQRVTAGGGWRPLAFYSAKLTTAQAKYSAFDCKLLAIYLSIRHFRFMLEGCSFTVFRDQRPLLGSLSRVSDPWSAHQRRQLSFIAEFAATLRHISGASNEVADTLSRLPAEGVAAAQSPPPQAGSPSVDIHELAAAQRGCQDCQLAATSPALTVLTAELDGVPVLVDVSSGVFRPVVPVSFRRCIQKINHYVR